MSSLFFGNVLWRKGMKLSILITLLNEELVLPQTHREISNQLEQMLGKELSDYEILYIDDGSSDQTYELITAIAKLKNLQEKTTASNISVSVEILDERAVSWLVLNMPVGMRLWSWTGISSIHHT